VVLNPKNCHDNHQESVCVSDNRPKLENASTLFKQLCVLISDSRELLVSPVGL
jgi:hypothetical protein